jgi:membrane protein
MPLRRTWEVIKSTVTDFINDEVLLLAAALTFYTALSLAPLLLIGVWVLSLVYSGEASEQAIQQAEEAGGPQAGEVVRTVLANAHQKGQSIAAATIGFATLLFSASGVFGQLQYSLNRIWNVKARANAPWWDWLRKRLWTLVMMAIIGAIVLASVAATAVLSVVQKHMEGMIRWPWLWWALNLAIPFFVYILLFAMIYKILPDVQIRWSNVWWGAIITAVLFSVGRHLIGWYIGRGATTSVYGAAGSLVALLTWLYYSSVIFFLGAEITQSIARVRGERIEPSPHAEWADPQRAAVRAERARSDDKSNI